MTERETDNKQKKVFITHLFDAPIEMVFKAWTDPAHLVNWYAPDGCTIEFKTIEVKQGGGFHSCIHDPVHGDCWVKGVYKEVIFPERLVFSMGLTDESGRSLAAAEAGKSEAWPPETIVTVIFTKVGKQTELTLHQTVAEAEAKKTGAYQSWIKMFNRLNALLIQTS